MPFGLRHRRRQPEVMDRPDLDPERHVHALQGLERINRWSGSGGILWGAIRPLARETGAHPLRVLDVATGAGDVAVGLWHRARRAGLALHVEGCDLSPRALEYARGRAEQQGADVEFFPLDALNGEIPARYDVIVCSLFLHHLDEDQAVSLLRRMARAANRMVLVNDLARSPAGLVLAYLGTRLLSMSPVVQVDGPVSVRAAFSLEEVGALAEQAGLAGATVERRWPCRFLLTWRRP